MLLRLVVLSATELLPRGGPHTTPPNCRVKIFSEGTLYKTKLIKRTLMPAWHETILISLSDMNIPITVQLWHNSSLPFTDYLLGETTIDLEEALMTGQNGHPIQVDLTRVSKGSVRLKSGTLLISAALVDHDSTASILPTQAKQLSTAQNGYSNTAADLAQLVQALPVNDVGGEGSKLLHTLSMNLQAFVSIVDEASKIHPIVCLAWNIVSSVFKAVQGQLERDVKIVDLLSAMDDIYSFLVTIHSMDDLTPALENNVDLALKQTVEGALFIQEYCGTGFAVRALQQTFSVAVQRKLDGFIETFKALHASLTTGVAMQSALISYKTLDRVDVLVRDNTLRRLKPVELDASKRPLCLPKTRIDLLQEITTWATTPTDSVENILWLHGLAGSGKSTISTTVANFFRDLRRLGAFVFFNRDEPERSSPSRVIRTLAAQLAAFDPRIGLFVAQAIDNIPSICESPLSLQFTELIIKPLAAVEQLLSEGPIVLILDALDECGNAATREQLLAVFAEQSRLLPSFVRVLITSRNEADIMDALEPAPNTRPCELDILTDTNGADISAFFHEKFRTIRGKRKNRTLCLDADWPGEEAIQSLVERAAGLFVWASTACAFIDAHDPRSRLHTLLHGDIALGPILALDNLYATALAAAGDWGDPDFVSSFQDIIGTVVVSMEPLTTDVVDGLLGLPINVPSIHTVERLGCVLSWGPNQPIRTLHPSFVDFLTNPRRCKRTEWLIGTAAHHRRLALRCLDLMEEHLKQNVAGLTLTMPDDNIMPKLSDSLTYACTFWIPHACSVTEGSGEVRRRILEFLTRHLLHWLEAMSILGKARLTIQLLKQLLEWIRNVCCAVPFVENVAELNALMTDAVRFARGAANMMEEHPLLIYHSALPYAPADSIIHRTFAAQDSTSVRVDGRSRHWPPILQVLSGHGANVVSVAVSLDGSRVASASLTDSAVRIWDTTSGAELMTPLIREESVPFSVAMSPDGQSVLVGYGDATVHVWDLKTGSIIVSKHITDAPPYCRILAVALSPTGSRFLGAGDRYFSDDYYSDVSSKPNNDPNDTEAEDVSNVEDGPVEVMDAEAETDNPNPVSWVVAVWDNSPEKPVILRGHTSGVRSAVFTNDGTKVVSGASDGTVILWDLTCGTALAVLSLTPIQPHTEDPIASLWITCVAVSPNDKQALVSDETGCIRIWDLADNVIVSSPVENGDSADSLQQPVLARSPNASTPVLFSPDGASFLSARRQVIRIWSAIDASVLAEYHGHSEEVTSVCYSQNTAQIISGSSDGTVRIWDATFSSFDKPRHFASAPERDYYMHLVQVTPDGKRVIFVPDLTTVCVLDVYADSSQVTYFGHQQQQRDQGIIYPVVSVACAPDGFMVASASSDNIICVWTLLSGVDLLPPFHHPHCHDATEPHQDDNYFFAVAFTADRGLVSGSSESIIIWDLDTGDKLFIFPRELAGLLETVFAPSGLTVIRAPDADTLDTEWEPWDDVWAHSCLSNPHVDVPPPHFNPLTLQDDGWIIRQSTGAVLSKLPSWLSVKRWVSSESMLAFTTHQAELFVMHFEEA